VPFAASDPVSRAPGETELLYCIDEETPRGWVGHQKSGDFLCELLHPNWVAKWDRPLPTCDPRPCPNPPDFPANSHHEHLDCENETKIALDPDILCGLHGDVISLECDRGYKKTRDFVCETGVFNLHEPALCIPKVCHVTEPLPNSEPEPVGIPGWGVCVDLPHLETCEFQCKPYHTKIGALTCNKGDLPTSICTTASRKIPSLSPFGDPLPFSTWPYDCEVGCAPNPCRTIVMEPGIRKRYNDVLFDTCVDKYPGDECAVLCAPGFRPEGVIVCRDEQFDLTNASCEPKKCKVAPPAVVNSDRGRFRPEQCVNFDSGRICVLYCKPGFNPTSHYVCTRGTFTGTTGSEPLCLDENQRLFLRKEGFIRSAFTLLSAALEANMDTPEVRVAMKYVVQVLTGVENDLIDITRIYSLSGDADARMLADVRLPGGEIVQVNWSYEPISRGAEFSEDEPESKRPEAAELKDPDAEERSLQEDGQFGWRIVFEVTVLDEEMKYSVMNSLTDVDPDLLVTTMVDALVTFAGYNRTALADLTVDVDAPQAFVREVASAGDKEPDVDMWGDVIVIAAVNAGLISLMLGYCYYYRRRKYKRLVENAEGGSEHGTENGNGYNGSEKLELVNKV
jgi:hypothetical protein